MLKLTQCLIVKNEEANLPRALGWGRGLVEEQLVVDTGSEDNSAALAESLGARVIRFDWTNDFSAARNFAISHCSGDWILFLDADEYFDTAELSLLRPLVEQVDGLSSLKGGKPLRYNVIETPWVNLRNHSISTQARIFRNDGSLRYEGALHEQLHPAPGGYRKVYSVQGKPAIYHSGYVWSEENSKAAKGARNFEIASNALKESPGCAKLQLHAADALMLQGKFKEAERYYAQALTNDNGSIAPERTRSGYKQWLKACLCLQKANPAAGTLLPAAMQAHAAAVAHFPDDPDFDFLISLFCFQAKNIQGAMRYCSNMLGKNGGQISEQLKSSHGEAFEKLRKICETLKKRHIL